MKITQLKGRYDIGHVLDKMGLNLEAVEVGVAFGENAEIILVTKDDNPSWYIIK